MNVEEKYLEMMQRAIDGMISPGERVELNKYLETHPAGRALYNELLSVAAELQTLPEESVSPNLKKMIMNRTQSKIITQPRRIPFTFLNLSRQLLKSRNSLIYHQEGNMNKKGIFVLEIGRAHV